MRLRLGHYSPDQLLRRILPRSLLGRSLLIVLVPLVLLEGVALQIFYGSHLRELSRRLSGAVAGEVQLIVNESAAAPTHRSALLAETNNDFLFYTKFVPREVFTLHPRESIPGPVDEDLASALHADIANPFNVEWTRAPDSIEIDVQMYNGVLHIDVPRKRLYIGSLYIFVVWLVGTALVFFGIAALFLRTQVRGIRRLAEAAEAFGMGRDQELIKPEGALEVRRAAMAFNRMQERVRRFLSQRTTMLAGVSHDLRTPLTRLRLAIAMLPQTPADERDAMSNDIDEMERLIAIYLNFARGEGREQSTATDLTLLLDDVTTAARRSGADINFTAEPDLTVTLRPEAMRRALTNLVDNARRHASKIWVSATRPTPRTLRVIVDDNGPGIPAEQRAAALLPFESADAGGTGLGLAIAGDIIGAHGGDMSLTDRPGGGLRVIIEMPA